VIVLVFTVIKCEQEIHAKLCAKFVQMRQNGDHKTTHLFDEACQLILLHLIIKHISNSIFLHSWNVFKTNIRLFMNPECTFKSVSFVMCSLLVTMLWTIMNSEGSRPCRGRLVRSLSSLPNTWSRTHFNIQEHMQLSPKCFVVPS
jgi:hypothetical protein